jgi:CRAL/TRIO domain
MATTSGWPWMKDHVVSSGSAASSSFADPPMDPVNEHDVRKAVKDLIAKHRVSIDKVKTMLEQHPLFDYSNKHDDLWILRFCMSHKNKPKDAAKAAEHALLFRDKHQLDSQDIRFHGITKGASDLPPPFARYMEYCTEDCLQWTLPDPQRGVISFLNFGGMDQHALVKNVEEKDWLPSFLHLSEWTFQWLDYVTRVTGRLTKSIRLIDAAQVKLSGISRECNRRDGDAMGVMEDIYPQMLQTLFVCHASPWIQVPWRVLRPLLPKRVVEKIDFIYPDKKENERKRLLEYLDEDHIPVRFGGKYEPWPVAYPLPSN